MKLALCDLFKDFHHLYLCILDSKFNFELNGLELTDKEIKSIKNNFTQKVEIDETRKNSYSTIGLNCKGLGYLVFDIPDTLEDWLKFEQELRTESIIKSIQNVKENASESNDVIEKLYSNLASKLKFGIFTVLQNDTIYGGFQEFTDKIRKLNLNGGDNCCFEITVDDGTCNVMVRTISEITKLRIPYNKNFIITDIKNIVKFIEDNLHDYIEKALDSVQESKLLSFRSFVNEMAITPKQIKDNRKTDSGSRDLEKKN